MEDFQKMFPHAHIYGLDIPGTGNLHLSSSFLSVRKNVLYLRDRFIKLVGTDQGQNNYLIGISLGGMMSIEWMQKFPEDFKKAILINTSMSGVSPLYHRMFPSSFFQLLFSPVMPKERWRQSIIYKLTSSLGNDRKKEVIDHWEMIAKTAPVSTANSLRQLWAGASFWPNKSRPAVPLQIFSSVQDHLVSHQCSERIAKLWDVPIQRHPTAGHDLLLDDPKWCAQNAAAFFLN
ncbi:MAG: alpha/beta hydrolase [Bacteriovoracaceae bacterium]|nr:alpha/beta hydrolase [Bacteriovoracaceae bacterium]